MGEGVPLGRPSHQKGYIMYYKIWAIIRSEYKVFTTDYLNFIQIARDPNVFILKFKPLSK